MDPKLCECGCGGAIEPKPHHKYLPQRFIRGHHKGRAYTPRPEEIPSGSCECGCGRQTEIAKITHRNRRHFAGHPKPYIHGHTPKKPREKHHKWKGGRLVHKGTGYVSIYVPEHPQASRKGYVLEHRLIMEQIIGRYLSPDEDVHHLNHVRDDNRPENLMILSKAEHHAQHHADRQEARRRYLAEHPDYLREAGKKGAAARWGKRTT